MKSLPGLRTWITLALGAAVAVVAYHWPPASRASLQAEYLCWHLAFSPDGTQLALLDREAGLDAVGQILVWDVTTGALRHLLPNGKKRYPSQVAFAPDGKALGVVDAGAVTQWDLTTGQLVAHHDHATWSHDPDRYPGREI